jgi:hypothetical protein
VTPGGEIYIYAPSVAEADGEPATPATTGEDLFTAKGVFRRRDDGLTAVTITDDELTRVKQQVERIAGALASAQAGSGQYAVDSITAHLGISASGRFFFVAEAGVEASIEVTWKRKPPDAANEHR